MAKDGPAPLPPQGEGFDLDPQGELDYEEFLESGDPHLSKKTPESIENPLESGEDPLESGDAPMHHQVSLRVWRCGL